MKNVFKMLKINLEHSCSVHWELAIFVSSPSKHTDDYFRFHKQLLPEGKYLLSMPVLCQAYIST